MASPDEVRTTLSAVYPAIITFSDTYSTSRLYKAFWCSEAKDVAVYTKLGSAAPTTLKVGAYQIVPLQIYGVLSTGTTATAGTVFGLYD